MSVVQEAKGHVRDVLDRSAVRLGLAHSEARLARDAQSYWGGHVGEDGWRNDSHWRDGSVFGRDVAWESVGAEHWALFEKCSRAIGFDRPLQRVVEWGCGGGANAVRFASECGEFVGVDVNSESLEECARQVKAATSTHFSAVLADVADPEAAVPQIGHSTADLFLCMYVLELVPSPEYGLRLLRIAHDLLAKDGLALVQIKYDTGEWRTQSRRRNYRGSVAASMTSYPIHEFWVDAMACGLRPELVTLVPQNDLDSRYAYFLLAKNG